MICIHNNLYNLSYFYAKDFTEKISALIFGDTEIHGTACTDRSSRPCCCLFRNSTQDKKIKRNFKDHTDVALANNALTTA